MRNMWSPINLFYSITSLYYWTLNLLAKSVIIRLKQNICDLQSTCTAMTVTQTANHSSKHVWWRNMSWQEAFDIQRKQCIIACFVENHLHIWRNFTDHKNNGNKNGSVIVCLAMYLCTTHFAALNTRRSTGGFVILYASVSLSFRQSFSQSVIQSISTWYLIGHCSFTTHSNSQSFVCNHCNHALLFIITKLYKYDNIDKEMV